jgi:predicted HAD superfamily Cof-like phosphohydrolase
MENQLQDVREFHRHIGAEVASKTCLLAHTESSARELAVAVREICDRFAGHPDSRTSLIARSLMSLEETAEWLEAHVAHDIIAAADAWADRLYVLLGDAIATGLPASNVFQAVHASNMTKAARDSRTGKGVKASGYQAPELALDIDSTRH